MSDAGLRCTTEFIAEVMARFEAMPPEAKAEMWRKQRESWIRAFAPCEHGDYDWETCPECLQAFADKRAAQGTEAGTAETEGLGPKDDGPVPEGDAPNLHSHHQEPGETR